MIGDWTAGLICATLLAFSASAAPGAVHSCSVTLRLYVQELLRAEQSMEAGLWDKGGNIMRGRLQGPV